MNKNNHFQTLTLLSITPNIAFAHAEAAIYIIGGGIISIQFISLALILLLKNPRYSTACLAAIPISWATVYLITDHLVNIEKASSIAIGLLMTPVYLLIFAKLNSKK